MATTHTDKRITKKRNTRKVPEASSEKKSLVLVLPETVTIENVEDLCAEARQINVLPEATLIIDASHTEILTTPGIQLLIAIAKSVQNAGGKLVISNPREPFKQSFAALGLGSRLTQWEVANG